jgi:large subunit ribosomal protein L9
MATTEVILREKIEGLGAEADVIRVKIGYARNFLIPSGKAFEATQGNLRHLAALTAARAQREAEELETASRLATKIEKLRPKFTLEAGQGGKAFGSVTSMDIHQKLEESKIGIERTAIKLDKPIKKSGKTDIEIRLHPEITATLKINIEYHEKGAEGAEEPSEKAEG